MPDIKMPIPAGMNAEQFQKLVNTFINSRATGQVKGKAQAAAMKDLRNKYAAEYQALVDKYTPKG